MNVGLVALIALEISVRMAAKSLAFSVMIWGALASYVYAASDTLMKPKLRDGVTLATYNLDEIEERLPNKSVTTADDKPLLSTEPVPALRDISLSPFVLTSVEIVGATKFSAIELAETYERFLARSISLADVVNITDAITELYRDNGFFLSRAIAPKQETRGGVLRIEVVEGYIEHVKFKGNTPSSIKDRFRSLVHSKPLRLKDFQQAVTAVNAMNGITAKDVRIEPDSSDLARHLLVVEIQVDRIEGSVYADNRGTPLAGPIQTHVSGAINSMFRTGDQLRLGFFTIPDDPGSLALGSFSYQLPITRSGAYVTFTGRLSHFEPGANLTSFDTDTRTKSLGVRFSYPLILQQSKTLWINTGFQGVDIEEEQAGVAQFNDKLRVASASLSYRERDTGGVTNAFGEISAGLDMFGSATQEVPLSRSDATGEFTKIEVFASRYQDIGDIFGVYLAVAGQVAFDPLPASEEFSLGGARFGRAYEYGELSGEDGVTGLVEMRYGLRPKTDILDFFQLYGFYDHGAIWNDNAPGIGAVTLNSAGGGIRLTFPHSFYATAEAARPINRVPYTQDDRDWRGFFSVSKNF